MELIIFLIIATLASLSFSDGLGGTMKGIKKLKLKNKKQH